MIRRTFLKLALGVVTAAAGLFPPLLGSTKTIAKEPHNGSWQIFVPAQGGAGPIVDGGYSTEDDATQMAEAFAYEGKYRVFPQEGRGVHNHAQFHIEPDRGFAHMRLVRS